ncbi:MAG: hypothetical protein ACR2ML_07370 [Solirubrobacteraceae bacterium]
MGKQEQSGDHISASFAGATVPGTVAVGKDIRQSQAVGTMSTQITDAEIAEVRRAFADLRATVQAQAPEERREAALERVDELEAAVVTEEPDPTTAAYVKGWFAKNVPQLAGAVVSVVVHPVVGKLVEAAGEVVADQFRKLVGGEA